ncbi:TetR/AcrR family transcriptional regulator [Ktedonosporobacter rubrisoli]|uniref:TetR/AcrR family transcriptional regulator n=1 Tax=Ktedonosporobacter rubrisoli TaxID=2509675 RepID=A0A4P6JLJ3_KTERU|nr:TetR/AcrR family transcriptional regulator [Ktedonosporobacter rubrisoli]QBD76089.1 TetR/AcrR family transcriptional regulator [Ktedonosporobacter rubrisoli]
MADQRSRARAEERRQALIEAAYQSIASHGLGELRTRDIAAQVGITHATLHHYFPTKEMLIRAVLQYAVQQRSQVTALAEQKGDTILERVHRFVASSYQQVHEDPTLWLVLDEFALRAKQDPAIRDIVLANYQSLHHYVTALLAAGLQQGELRADLDPESAATLLIMCVLGMSLVEPILPSSEKLVTQLERWLTS